MANFFSFVYDETAKTEKFYTDLTDEDIRYIEAAARRDNETTSILLNKHFHQKMTKTRCKRIAWRRDNKKDIWIYQIKRRKKSDAGWCGEGVYFYGAKGEAVRAVEYGYWLQGFYLNIENPFIMDWDLHNALSHMNSGKVSERMTEALKGRKMDGVFWGGQLREEWCVLDPRQMKRASVTRDDFGRIIPLSRRFDLTNPDNRF